MVNHENISGIAIQLCFAYDLYLSNSFKKNKFMFKITIKAMHDSYFLIKEASENDLVIFLIK